MGHTDGWSWSPGAAANSHIFPIIMKLSTGWRGDRGWGLWGSDPLGEPIPARTQGAGHQCFLTRAAVDLQCGLSPGPQARPPCSPAALTPQGKPLPCCPPPGWRHPPPRLPTLTLSRSTASYQTLLLFPGQERRITWLPHRSPRFPLWSAPSGEGRWKSGQEAGRWCW